LVERANRSNFQTSTTSTLRLRARSNELGKLRSVYLGAALDVDNLAFYGESPALGVGLQLAELGLWLLGPS
jgi:hypothetical protein